MNIDFAPSVYEHAAALIGETPWRASRDPELLFRAHAEAFRLYGHAPVVVGIDIYNLEAEAYGATVEAPDGNGVPSVSGHPCPTTGSVLKLDLLDPGRDGRIPMVVGAGRRLASALPGADVRIPVSGPFSLMCNLVGFDNLLCEVMDDPQAVRRALDHLARGQAAFCREILSHGLGIALFESGATPPLISPEVFARVELPALRNLIGEVSSAAGRPVPCIIGGNTFPVLDSILETGTGYVICPSETDQASFMRRMADFPGVMVRVNTDPGVFASGDWAVVRGELDRVLSLAGARRSVCIGTGVLPFEADPGLVLAAKRFMRDSGGGRRLDGAGDARPRA